MNLGKSYFVVTAKKKNQQLYWKKSTPGGRPKFVNKFSIFCLFDKISSAKRVVEEEVHIIDPKVFLDEDENNWPCGIESVQILEVKVNAISRAIPITPGKYLQGEIK